MLGLARNDVSNSLISSITFPFIRSNRTEFYFSVSVCVTIRKQQRR